MQTKWSQDKNCIWLLRYRWWTNLPTGSSYPTLPYLFIRDNVPYKMCPFLFSSRWTSAVFQTLDELGKTGEFKSDECYPLSDTEKNLFKYFPNRDHVIFKSWHYNTSTTSMIFHCICPLIAICICFVLHVPSHHLFFLSDFQIRLCGRLTVLHQL